MADLSFSFDPTAGEDASSRIAESSTTWQSGSPSDAASKVSIVKLSLTSAISALSVTAASAASDFASAAVVTAAAAASSKVVVARSSAKSWVSAVSVTAASAASDAASAAIAAASVVAASAASDAASAMVATLHGTIASSYIKSLPTTGSRAVHEIVYTASNEIKYVYSGSDIVGKGRGCGYIRSPCLHTKRTERRT